MAPGNFSESIANIPDSVRMSPIFETYLWAEQSLAEQRSKSSRSEYFPAISLGYFNQQIEGTPGLDGVTAGVSVPLWFAPQKEELERNRLEQEVISHQSTQFEVSHVQWMRTQFDAAKVLMRHHAKRNKDVLFEARGLAVNSLEAYQNEEIDHFQFLQASRASLRLEMNYWNLRLAYWKAIENLQFYIK